MADPRLDETVEGAAHSRREPSAAENGGSDGSEATDAERLAADGADRPLADLVKDVKREAEAVLDEANRLSLDWLQEAQLRRAEALAMREEVAEELAAARADIEHEREAAGSRAREIVEQAAAEAAAKAESMIAQTEATLSVMTRDAEIEAERVLAEARREAARILLDARARVDEVRGRLIRLYQEMESAVTTSRGTSDADDRSSRSRP